jgi:hypothetical protein
LGSGETGGAVDRFGIDGDLFQFGFDIGWNVLLVTSVEIFGEELFHCGDHREIVDGPSEPVAFVRGDEVFNGFAVIAYGGDDLAALADVDAGSFLPWTTISGVTMAFALARGDSAISRALPSGVLGSAMRVYICLRDSFPIERNGIEEGDAIGRGDDS